MSENAGGPHHTAPVCAVRPCRTGSWPALPRDEQCPAFHDCSASSQQHAWWKEGEWREGREVERERKRGGEREEERGKDSEGEEEEGRRKEKRKERRGRSARGRRKGKRE